MYSIKKAAVIGSGIMGSAIAAHLANVGISTLLLDKVPDSLLDEEKTADLSLADKKVRNRLAAQALERIRLSKPSMLTSASNEQLLEIGNMEDDFEALKEADWIIEAITEDINAKKSLFCKVDAVRRQGAIISSNTSGISITEMKEGLSEDFQTHFLGTHFFNPPRYILLLEFIPTNKTSSEVISYMKTFAETVLGRVVVEAKDTPNFIANRIGAHAFLTTLDAMVQMDLTISEVDRLTGPFIGRTKSATFQTLDMVGLDTFFHTVKNVRNRTEDTMEKEQYKVPVFLLEMLNHKMLGRKTKQGFYKKTKEKMLVLDYHTMQYVEEQIPRRSKSREKLKELIYDSSPTGVFLWKTVMPYLLYSGEHALEIAENIFQIDLAIKTGFNFKQGPFETWDEIGLTESLEKLKGENQKLPEWIEDMIKNGFTSFYKSVDGKRSYYHNGKYEPIPLTNDQYRLEHKRQSGKVIAGNKAASIVNMDDGVLLLEMHSQNNIIGMDMIKMLNKAVTIAESTDSIKGLVIGSSGKNFSAGANLAMMLLEGQNQDYLELEIVVKEFQEALKRIKYCKKPVVAASHRKTLGGGAEICLAAAKIHASIETYIGLVEISAGLIPGGGGTKELYLNLLDEQDGIDHSHLITAATKAFEAILTSNVSTSAEEGKTIGFLSSEDSITFNSLNVMEEAKQTVIKLFETGYEPPVVKKIPVAGKEGFHLLQKKVQDFASKGAITKHGEIIAAKLAYVLTGGDVPIQTEVEEDYLLGLERQAFIDLLKERETLRRMLYLLTAGKPLPL